MGPIIRINPRFLLFATAMGEVAYGVDEETFLLGIFTSFEQAHSMMVAYSESDEQVNFFNHNEDECHLYLNECSGEYYLVYDTEDGRKLYSDEQLARMKTLRWSDLVYKIVEYWGDPVHVTGTTYAE